MKKKYTFIIIAITFLLMIVGIYVSDGPDKLKEVIENAKPENLRMAFILMALYFFTQIIILKELTNNLGENLRLSKAAKTYFIGEFFSAITPLATGGQPLQVVYMKKLGIKPGKATSILGIQLFFYHIARIILCLVLTIYYKDFFYFGGYGFTFFIFLGLILNIGLALFMLLGAFKPNMVNSMAQKFASFLNKIKLVKNIDKLRTRIDTEVEMFSNSIKDFRGQNLSFYVLLILQNIISFIFFYGIGYFVFKAFGIQIETFTIALAAQTTVALVSSYVPLPGGSFGAEGIFYLIFSQLVPEGAPIFLSILLWRVLTYYTTILVSFPFTLKLE